MWSVRFAAYRPRDYLAMAQRMRRPVKRWPVRARGRQSIKEATDNTVVSTNDRHRLARRATDGAADV